MTTPRTTYTLVIEALSDDTPPVIRLRRALKYLLRTTRFRCVLHVEGEHPEIVRLRALAQGLGELAEGLGEKVEGLAEMLARLRGA